MSRLDEAVDYFRRDLPIFPLCSPGAAGRCLEGHPASSAHDATGVGKTPLVRWHAYQNRLPTEAEVRAWWRRWPHANIGMATGELSGLCVIDLDGGAARAEAARRGLPPGPVVTTGRIGGTHHYYRWRADAPTIFAKTSGIDFRGQGGYVVLPPSRHRSGANYTWRVDLGDGQALEGLPHWIDGMGAQTRRRGPVQVEQVIAEHVRNDSLVRLGGAMRRVGFSVAAIKAALEITNDERCQPPLGASEVASIAHSVARYAPAPEWLRRQPDGAA